MRIAIHCSFYGEPWNEGVKNMVSKIVASLRANGHEAIILTRSLTGEADGAMEVGPEPFSGYARAGAIAAAHGADLIHTIQSINPLTGTRTRLIQEFAGMPLLLHVTGIGLGGWSYRWLEKADQVVVGSRYLRRFYPEADVLTAIPNLEDLSPIPPNPDSETPMVAFLGAFEPGRGVETLLEASAILHDRAVDHRLALAWNGVGGTTGEARIRERATALGISLDIRGTVDIRQFCGDARVVVIPRRSVKRMSLPLRIIECALLERPMVVSRILDMEIAVGKMGSSFPSGDAPALADALAPVLQSNTAYNNCVDEMRRRRSEFLPEVTYEKLFRIYRRLCP